MIVCVIEFIQVCNMRLFELAQLKESMTMWVPDAPRKDTELTCEFCDGTGIDSFYNPKTGRSYYQGDGEVKERLVGWDKRLKAYFEKKESIEMRTHTIQSFYDANIKNHPDLKDKFEEQFAEIAADKKKVNALIDRRIARIEKKVELVKQLETIDCGFCKGKGTYQEEVSDAPEMNLSNVNAQALMSALGYEPGYGYSIKPEEVPAVKRKIMQLMNKEGELGQHTRDPEDSQKDFGMVRSTDPETGLDKIERKKGPRMIGAGIDIDYLKDKFERMMPILDYAQKHNQEIHFA